MGKHKKYFQFPLCMLHYGDTFNETLNSIMQYGILYYGLKKAGFDIEEWYMKVARDRHARTEWTLEALKHGEELGTFQNERIGIEQLLNNGVGVFKHVQENKRLFGNSPLVRIEKELLYRIRDERSLSEREFSVLCAIYSSIGKSKFKRIRLKDIRHRAAGFKTREHLDTFLEMHGAGKLPAPLTGNTVFPLLLTEKKIRDTVSGLHSMNFFAKASTGNATYYSHRLKDLALRNAIVKAKTFKDLKKLETSRKDKLLQEAIRRIKQGGSIEG